MAETTDTKLPTKEYNEDEILAIQTHAMMLVVFAARRYRPDEMIEKVYHDCPNPFYVKHIKSKYEEAGWRLDEFLRSVSADVRGKVLDWLIRAEEQNPITSIERINNEYLPLIISKREERRALAVEQNISE